MNKINPYFYILRHKQSGIMYAGSRYTTKGCHPNELLKEDGYITSSSIVRTIISENGLNSFEISKIITQEEIKQIGFSNVREYESHFLKEHGCRESPGWFNQSNSGGGERNIDKIENRYKTKIIICKTNDNTLFCPIQLRDAEEHTIVGCCGRGEDIFTMRNVPKEDKIRINKNGKNYTWHRNVIIPNGASIGYYISERQRESMSKNGKKGDHNKGGRLSEESKEKMRKSHWSKTKKIKHPLLGIGHTSTTKEKIAFDKNGHFYKVISPYGDEYIICSVGDFAKKHGLSSPILRYYMNKKVPEVEFQKARITQERLRSVGWTLSPVFGSFSEFLGNQKLFSTN